MTTRVHSGPSRALVSTRRDLLMWSHTADALKSEIFTWRLVVLSLIVAGAALEAAAATLPPVREVAAYLGAFALACVPVIRASKVTGERFRNWVRTRSASESLKAENFLYFTRVGPYADVDPDRALLERSAKIQESVRDLATHAAMHTPTDASVPHTRLTIDEYIEVRVEEQITNFYEPRAKGMARRLRWVRRAEFALSLLAAMLGVVAARRPDAGFGVWAPVLTTVIAALATHVEAGRYEYQVISYRGTAQRLRQLRDRWLDATGHTPATPAQEAEFVQQCEDAISSENQSWMAELTRV